MLNPSLSNQGKILKGPYQMSVDITNKCNYRCLHCYNYSGENNVVDNELSEEEFLNLFREIGNMQPYNVCLCGGEPTIKLDLLIKCSRILHESGIKNISLVSNGYYIDEKTAKLLKENYINRVQISLDGSNTDSCFMLRQNREAFDKAILALKILKKAKIQEVYIACCPTKYNISEINEICDLCRTIGIQLIRMQPLMITGRAVRNMDDILPTNMQYIELKRIINAQNKTNDIFIDWADPIDHLIRYRDSQKELSTFVSIKANGSIMLSPYLPLSLGNIKKHSITEYWEAGLAHAWNLEISQKFANEISSIYEMGQASLSETTVWLSDDVEFDIIDNRTE